MKKQTAEVAPRARTVELVKTRGGEWAPAPRQHPAIRAVRTWLRVCVNPTDPAMYLGPTELCLIRTPLHWVVPLKRLAMMAVSMLLAILLAKLIAFLLPSVWWVQVGTWLGAVAHQAWIAYQVVAWRCDEIIVTDKRVIRSYGVFSSQVDDVNLMKITDRSYRQSFLGYVFNYGSLRIVTSGESSDREQNVKRLEFVPNPGEVYRATLH